MAVTEVDLRREIEWRRCKASFPYFYLRYWKVIDVQRGRINVDEWPDQIESARAFQKESRVIVLKARQIGWTTLITAYCFWKGFFFPDQRIMALSRRERPEAQLIISNMKAGYGMLPLWMRTRGPKPLNDATGSIVWSNGSVHESDASKDSPARGRTLSLLVLDEFGKFPNQDDAWKSALPAAEKGQLFVIGNADRWGSLFHTLYLEAKAGKNNFKAFFYPWNVRPDRDAEWYARETSSMTPAQRASEYPSNDTECWLAAGSPVFDADILAEIETRDTVPGVLFDRFFRPVPSGPLRVWHEPEPGHRYVIGVDVAKGLEHGDWSVAQVINVTTMQHCATWKGRLPAAEYAMEIDALGRWYNYALLVVESNGPGDGVIYALRMETNYRNLYYEERFNERARTITKRAGFTTSERSKGVAIANLWAKVRAGIENKPDGLRTESPSFVKEMMEFRYLGDGKMGGSPHDDEVMAMAIGLMGLSFAGKEPTLREALQVDRRLRALYDWEGWEPKTTSSNYTHPKPVTTSAARTSGARFAPFGLSPRPTRPSWRTPVISRNRMI